MVEYPCEEGKRLIAKAERIPNKIITVTNSMRVKPC